MQIPSFEGARVLVAGDLMLDRYWQGAASRISPEAPVPVVRIGACSERPGGAGNVALNIAALGARVTALGYTGADEAGLRLRGLLEQAGVTPHILVLDGYATVTKLRVLSRHQQLIRLDFEDATVTHDAPGLLDGFRDALSRADVVVLSDYGKGALQGAPAMIRAALEARRPVPVLVDPKGLDFDRYRNATLVTPNRAEFEAVVGPCEDDATLVEKARALLAAHSIGAVLITRGEQGMTLVRPDAEALHLAVHAHEVYDVTGAGDTVIGVLAAGLAAGMDLGAATALANLAAGIVVGKLGAASVSVAELRRALR
ncbi:MAG: D-glycero-beta-D-manno-heptose-7-phosphate kinase, partial [Gammaproteobacteria bacterium]